MLLVCQLRENCHLFYLEFGQVSHISENHMGCDSAPVALELPEQYPVIRLNCIQGLLHTGTTTDCFRVFWANTALLFRY